MSLSFLRKINHDLFALLIVLSHWGSPRFASPLSGVMVMSFAFSKAAAVEVGYWTVIDSAIIFSFPFYSWTFDMHVSDCFEFSWSCRHRASWHASRWRRHPEFLTLSCSLRFCGCHPSGQEGSGDFANLKAGLAMPWWIFIQKGKKLYIYIYYWNCKYIGSSRLGSHLFECFGLQGFPLLTHDMQALTPVSAPPLTPLPCVLARASDTCGFKAINHWCVTTKFVNLQFCRLLPLPFQIVFPHVFPVHAKVVHAFFQDLHSSFLCLPAPLAPQEGTDHAATLKAWLFLSSSTIQAFLLIR